MSAPGGKEVGRVSVRVVPNTARFGADLRRELRGLDTEVKVPVDFDADPAKLAARLSAMRIPTIKVPVDFDINKTLRTQLAAIAKGNPIKVPVDFDIDKTKLNTQLAAIKPKPIKVPVEFDVDQAAFERLAAQRNIEINVDIDTTAAQAQLAALTAEAFVAGTAMQVAGGRGTSAFTGMGSAIAGAVGTAVKLAGASFLIAEAGAAVTVAWGAVSTAIAAVPAAIGLLGAPIATVMLGMDGIKKAAQTLKPEFDKLKASVSATFEKGLTPILRSLKNDLLALQGPFNAIAQSLVGIANQTSIWIQTQGGLAQIQAMFLNIAAALNSINLVPLLDGFTKLAGNQAGLSVIVGLINQIGLELQKIADSEFLTTAFIGLEGVLKTLTTAFGDLVRNGIEVFAAAAPGAQAGIQGIGEFFNKFDWTALGAAAGGAIRGLGDALKSIPQGTVDDITRAFTDLSTLLQSPEFKQGLTDLAAILPPIVDALTGMLGAAARAATEIHNLLNPMEQFSATSPGMKQEAAALRAEMDRLAQGLANNVPGIEKDLSKLPPILQEKVRGMAESIRAEGPGVVKEMGNVGAQVPPAFLNPIQPLPGMAGQIMGQVSPELVGPLASVPGQVGSVGSQIPQALLNPLQPMPGQAGAIMGQVPPAVEKPLLQIPGIIDSAVGPAPSTLGAILDPMAPQAQTAGGRIVVGFGTGIGDLSPTLQQELGFLPPIATTGWGNVVGTVQPGLAPAAGEVTAGLDPAQQALAQSLAGMAGIVPTSFVTPFQQALTTGFGVVTAAIPTLFTLPFQTALTTAFTTVTAAIPTLFTTPFQTALTTAFTTITAQIPTLFTLPFQTALTTAFTTVTAAIPTLFTTPFQTALTTAFTTIFAQFPTIFTLPFQTALTTALTAIFAQFPTIFTLPFQTALTTAFTTIFAQFPTLFTLPFQTALTTAMTAISAQIPALFVPINTAFTTAFAAIVALIQPQLDAPMVAAVQLAMTNFNNEINTGFDTVVQSVIDGANRIIDILNQLPPAGQQTGQNLITAMSNAILAGQSQLVNAIAQVIAAAIAAATAMLQIGSPSKVSAGWGDSVIDGFVNHVRDGKREVVSSVKDTFGAAVTAGQGISDAVTSAMGFDGAALHSRVSAVGTLNAAPAPPVNVFIGDEPFRGQIRTEIGSYDSRLRHARSVRGGR